MNTEQEFLQLMEEIKLLTDKMNQLSVDIQMIEENLGMIKRG